ncbi:MAG TPA: CPBP family intramembrane glutamic endopeptidase [Candidatus Saccharimonadales bacterium]|nr:CPBP family intramembrane glutamic endopeptidase [Candidatus Saccharimonadales bacterium]
MSYGIAPTDTWHLVALAVPLAVWQFKRSEAKKRRITIFHNSSLAVSYWEELLFRGLLWGLALEIWHNTLSALIISSLLFGLFHMRNAWWSSRKQLLAQCLYTGLIFAPIVGAVRWWSGDIYLGIALHSLHNFISMYYTQRSGVPTDDYLKSQRYKMNWFERFFSGFWLRRDSET